VSLTLAPTNEHARVHRAELKAVHRAPLKGYTAELSVVEARRLQADRRVRSVEPDKQVSLSVQTTPTGVDRVAVPTEPGVVGADLTTTGSTIAGGPRHRNRRHHPDLNLFRTTGLPLWRLCG
jgi:hypothetical protein